MSWAPASPVTGGAQTGFTTPTYTLVADTAPDVNGKQFAVSAIGGTQAGVTVHSVAAPFTATFWKPKTFRSLGKPNPTTGLIANVQKNVYKQVVRKGVLPLAGQPYQEAIVTLIVEVPAGSDTADAANVRAAISLALGAAWAQSAGIGDTAVSGVM